MSELDTTCSYCRGFRVVDGIDGVIACRVCLGTGGAPYEGELGHAARARELRRIGELVRQYEDVTGE